MAWLCGRCADLRMAAAVDWEEDQMKFHDPETGEVVSIPVAVSRYCKTKGRWCCKCSLPGAMNQSEKPCEPWAEAHPHEAARLMGFEVVEDEQFREVTKMMKEANMDKPRICDVLGVNVDEEFEFDFDSNQVSRGTMKIGADGLRYYKDKKDWFQCWNEKDLIYIINHPDRIIRKPRFTQQEVELFRAIQVLYPKAEYVERIKDSGVIGLSNNTCGWIMDIDKDLFQALRPGESVKLDEIIGGAQ